MNSAKALPDKRELIHTYLHADSPMRRMIGQVVMQWCCVLAVYPVFSAILLFLLGVWGVYGSHSHLAVLAGGMMLSMAGRSATRRADQLLGPCESITDAEAHQRLMLEALLEPWRHRIVAECLYLFFTVGFGVLCGVILFVAFGTRASTP